MLIFPSLKNCGPFKRYEFQSYPELFTIFSRSSPSQFGSCGGTLSQLHNVWRKWWIKSDSKDNTSFNSTLNAMSYIVFHMLVHVCYYQYFSFLCSAATLNLQIVFIVYSDLFLLRWVYLLIKNMSDGCRIDVLNKIRNRYHISPCIVYKYNI